jgi:hypothetical protein
MKKIFLLFLIPSLLLAKETLQKTYPLPTPTINCENFSKNSSFTYLFNLNFLYYQAKEDNLYFATENNDTSNIFSPNFDWDIGFKVGAGIFFKKASLNFYLNWTTFSSDSKKSISGNLSPLFYNASAFSNENNPINFTLSKASLNFDFNSLDIEFGSNFFVNKNLSFKLHGGVKGILIKQKFNVKYENGNIIVVDSEAIKITSSNTHLKNNIKGAGPRVGINSKWNIKNSNFNFLCNGAVALLLTRFNMHFFEEDKGYEIVSENQLLDEYKIHEYVWVIRPSANILLGINFGKCFRKKYLGCNIAYNLEYFFEHNLTRRLIDDGNEGLAYPNKGDLFLHGLDLSLCFNF